MGKKRLRVRPLLLTKACQTKVGDEAAPITGFKSLRFESKSSSRAPKGTHLTREERDMKNFADSIVKFLKEEDGPTAVEYAVMLALIVIVCLTAIQAIGTNANTTFGKIRDAIQTANS